MKKLLQTLWFLLTLGLFVGCSAPATQPETGPNPEPPTQTDLSVQAQNITLPAVTEKQLAEATLPPSRIGTQGMIKATHLWRTFDSAFQDADAVAIVQVRNWRSEEGEAFDPAQRSYYDAIVIESFKGSLPEEIVLTQDGNSRFTYQNYPLFTYGNNLFLFLRKDPEATYENGYRILGSQTTVMDVVQEEEGDVYLLARRSQLVEELAEYHVYGAAKYIDLLTATDPVISEFVSHPYVFSLKEFMSHISKLQDGS